ncbi:MAG: damage-inducible protein DinB [Treponema sp.]|jgi:uncharacterized damage-inducible protein DinB|nr:damage-inducible protein DinB [Treponema sp.]
MKENVLIIAKYNEKTNKTIAGILGKLSNKDREKNRKSFYGSLSALFRHNIGATVYFLSLFADAVKDNAEALKAVAPLSKTEHFKGKLTEAQWKKVVSFSKIVDKALIDFINALREEDFNAAVNIDWYKGNPPSVPLRFMLQQHTVHNIHHRGQISQILDSMKIPNDFSGISIKLL